MDSILRTIDMLMFEFFIDIFRFMKVFNNHKFHGQRFRLSFSLVIFKGIPGVFHEIESK